MEEADIKFWKDAGHVARRTIEGIKGEIVAGKSWDDLIDSAERFIRRHGGTPAFPVTISVNDIAAHYTTNSILTKPEGLEEEMVFEKGDLVKLGILVNSEPVDALAMMIHKDFAQRTGRDVCEKLKDLIPRHNFMIPVQAAIGGKIIARETIKGFKKDVLTKIHGGGATDRKRKLLEKQKKGKARSKQFGRVEIPQEAFIGVLKINKEN